MSLFSFGKEKKEKKPAKQEKKKEGQKKAADPQQQTQKKATSSGTIGGQARDVLLRPLFTEKAVGMEAERKYVFAVDPRANKPEVRKAVEKAYGVSVDKVAIINEPAKQRSWRGRRGSAAGMKKAIVTLAEGQSIEIVSH